MFNIYNYTVTDKEVLENVFKKEGILMNHVVIEAGKVFPKHPTDAEVYAIVLKGELSVTLEDLETQTFSFGQVLNIAKGVMSELGNNSDELLELLVIKV